MDITTFEDFLEKLKEIVPDYKQIEEKYVFQLSANTINSEYEIRCEVNNQFFYLSTSITTTPQEEITGDKKSYNRVLKFQGIFHELSFFYIYTIFSSFKNNPYVFMSVFFAENVTDLKILVERLVYANIEFNCFLKNFLLLDKWDGERIEIKNLKYIKAEVNIDKSTIPHINILFTKNDEEFEKMFTLYDWLLYVAEDISWLDADGFTLKIKELPKITDREKGYIKEILNYYGADTKDLMLDYIDIPIKNSFVIKTLFFMNDLGIILKLYTTSRPFDSFDIKIPYRNDLINSFNTVSKFIYLLSNDENGDFTKSLLYFFDNIKNIYIKIFF